MPIHYMSTELDMRAKEIHKNTKRRICNTIVRSIMLYGAETWDGVDYLRRSCQKSRRKRGKKKYDGRGEKYSKKHRKKITNVVWTYKMNAKVEVTTQNIRMGVTRREEERTTQTKLEIWNR